MLSAHSKIFAIIVLMRIKDLTPNKRNPRKITAYRLEAMADSLRKFGDLSGIVWNKRTKRLVGGHQRSKTMPPDSSIIIDVKYEKPTESHTVAEGYVLFGKERIKYREVDASEEWEAEAMVAANAHGGEWDHGMLEIIKADFPNLDLRLAGLEISAPVVNIAPVDLGSVSASGFSEDEESDEDYVKNNPGPESSQDKESFDSVNRESVFSNIQEENKSILDDGKFLVIIKCKDSETRDAVRKKLREGDIVTTHGAIVF